MSKIFLDLRSIYNHRAVCPDYEGRETLKKLGMDNYLKPNTLHFDRRIKKSGIECIFRKAQNGLDNVECNAQLLDIEPFPVKKITISGFCIWGTFQEDFILKGCDGSTRKAVACFSDVIWPLAFKEPYAIGEDKKMCLDRTQILCEVEWDGNQGYIYYFTTEFPIPKLIKQILFPDNCFMHIFAITIEN